MMIRTTINIDAEVAKRLIKAAKRQGVEIEEIICALMRYYSKKHRKEINIGNGVCYQERRPKELWVCMHVNWFAEEYEFLIDLRKVHKKSVSFLIALMVMQHIDENGSFIDMYLDNYQSQPYFITKFIIHNAIGCIFLWGKPIKSLSQNI